MKPTVGRIVHYFNSEDGDPPGNDGLIPRAAIITKVEPTPSSVPGEQYRVSISVFFPKGLIVLKDVRYSDKPERGCWSWPPRG